MNEYHERWDDADCVSKFSEKKQTDFFKSEIYFIEKIVKDIDTVLDIGCASGRFIELLRCYRDNFEFFGIDIAENNIANARKLYSEYKFECINALDFQTEQTFDLVNATGVCQHEPEFESLITKMVMLSSRYVLFDVKLAKIDSHIVDQAISYSGKEHKLYFIMLSLTKLVEYLKTLSGISRIDIYGYITKPNKNTVTPDGFDDIVSANVMIYKGKPDVLGVECKYDIPEFLIS